MATLLFFMAALFVAGFGGGLFIGARAVPERLTPATLLWLAAFFVGLAMVLWLEGDPALSGEAARRNAPFAFVLYGVLLGGPWAGGTFAGRKIGRALRGGKGPAVAGESGALRQAQAAMREAAARIGIPAHVLPGLSEQPEGAFIENGPNGGFVYVTTERATRMSEERAADVDELLYLVFRDRAWMQAYTGLTGQDLSPEAHAAQLAEGQLELLRKGDPRWAERLLRERAA